jgi:Alr-MurF fusion protein
MRWRVVVISLYDILEASNGQLFGEPGAHIFTNFCFDARQAAEAQLFVALKTERGDTHQYIQEAVDKGVLGILCTHPPEFDTQGLTIIIVKDTEAALMAWARYVLSRLGTQVVCVAGTAGKSLTVEAINHVLSTRYQVLTTSAETAGWLNLVSTLAQLTPEHQFIVLELNIRRPGELAEIAQTLQPDVVVIPGIGRAFTDAFSDVDEIVAEHRLLLDYLTPTGLAVLNFDDEQVASLASVTRARVLTAGMERFGADLMAYNVVVSPSNTGFDLRYGSDRFVGRWIPWLGKHQLNAALTGLAVGVHYDAPLEDALRALTNAPYLPGRMTPFNGLNNCLLIDDTYTATPQSVVASLNWLQSIRESAENEQRLIFVMGDMDHLGISSQIGHRIVGQRAAEVADIIITEGKDAALAARTALDKGKEVSQVCVTYSIQDTISALKDRYQVSRSDTVLITGGASARMELVTQSLLRNVNDKTSLPRQNFAGEMDTLIEPTRLSWVETDLEALAVNVRGIKTLIGDQVAFMAVVKGDGYGHGALSVSRTALLNGAEYLAVSSISEALELREAGIEEPILMLNYTPVSAVREAVRQRITLTLYDLDLARAYERIARELGAKLLVHVKVDTGMGRLGVLKTEAMNLFRHLMNLSHLEVEGIYTHFAAADEDPEFTEAQVRAFKEVLKPLRASGFNFAYVHAANSAGTLASKDNHFNMVRVGLAMYGLSPSPTVRVPKEFRPVLSWKTVIAQVKTLPRGHAVGYGRTYVTADDERIAIIPVGYADGFRRAPKNWGEVLVHGQRAPVIGRVSMEKSAINVSHIPDVSIGDEVVLLGTQGNENISADDVAVRLGTNSYEVITGILPRVPRR